MTAPLRSRQGPIRDEVFSKSRREELAIGPSGRRHKPSAAKARITVTIRKRPLTNEEVLKNECDVVKVNTRKTVVLEECRRELAGTEKITPHPFTFDRVYDENATNLAIYNSCVRKLVDTVFEEGTKCSCFAFGQTGSGKTFTMLGPTKPNRKVDAENKGLWAWAAKDIMTWMQKPQFNRHQLLLSFFEIHCNKAYDLLNNREQVRPLESAVGGVVVRGLVERPIESEKQMLETIDIGVNTRSTGRNSRNTESSRSHAILQIEVRGQKSTHGKIAFIDLAGSERGADSVQYGRNSQQDGAGINKSLLALKECIRAMDQGKGHIPFRDSELTKILRDFFTIDNGLCLMIATAASSSSCSEQTLNTLRYAQRFIAVRENAQPCITESDEFEDELPSTESYTESRPVTGYNSPGECLPRTVTHRTLDSIDRVHSTMDMRHGSPSASSTSSSSMPRQRPATTGGLPSSESVVSSSGSMELENMFSQNFLMELAHETKIDIEALLKETMDDQTRRIVKNIMPQVEESDKESFSQNNHKQILSMLESSAGTAWEAYRQLLKNQSIQLRLVCQLIQAHIRVCREMDSDLEQNIRPSIQNFSTLTAKIAAINTGTLRLSRMFLDREVGSLMKLAHDLNAVDIALTRCKRIEQVKRQN